MKFNNEQLRVAENLSVAYDNWIQAARIGFDHRDRVVWKRVGDYEYLYRLRDRSNNGTSLGPRNAENEKFFAEYNSRRTDANHRARASMERITAEIFPIYKSLRMPMIAAEAGEILREIDTRRMLGDNRLLVVGTTAMAAYEMEAMARFIGGTGWDATDDFDLSWAADRKETLTFAGPAETPLMSMLKAVDDTYTVNQERDCQARNKKGYEVEILMAPSRAGGYPKAEPLRAVALPEQEWLLLGKPVNQVVFDRLGKPARIVAPDPRWQALLKWFISHKPDRNSKKVLKDRRQAELLVRAIREHMPQYPFDNRFAAEVPPGLESAFKDLQMAATASDIPRVE